MTNTTDAACAAANAPGLPDYTRRLIEIEDAIAKIRTQIATADLARQRTAKPIDPDWFHRARTALRHLNRERAELIARQGGRSRRERLKDAIIATLRERHDSAAWIAVLAEARARLERRRMLELVAAQAQAELGAACHAAHRDMLRLKLEAIQAELDALAP